MKGNIISHLPVYVIIVPLFIAFILPTLSKRLRLIENLVLLAGLFELGGALSLAYLLFKRNGAPIVYTMGGWKAPWGIELVVNYFGVFFLLVIAAITLTIAIYARNNLLNEVGDSGKVARFYVLYLLLSGALSGMALTNDLFNIFVLVEVATLSCCGLVSSSKHIRSAEAAFRYLILATLGSAFVLGGIGFLYVITGHLNISFLGGELQNIWQYSPHVVWMTATFFLVGFGVKSALFPLHIWLPDAHSIAPTPASAILSGLAVKGYIICLFKILYNIFGPTLLRAFTLDRILPLAGMIAIIAGSLYAIKENEVKRRLAYSTVAQVGYIFLGFGLLNIKSLAGALFYLASHALIKVCLFLTTGAMINVTGIKDIKGLAGIGRKMPLTMAAFTIASFGLMGIPLFSGFVGKWHLLLGSLEAENFLAAFTIILGSVLCAVYLFPIIRSAYFESTPEKLNHDPGLSQKIALLILSLAIIALGTFPGPLLNLAQKAAYELLAQH